MTEQQCTVAAEIVHILVSVHIPLARTDGAGGVEWIGEQSATVVRQAGWDHLAGARIKLA
jgi:hypothetical protein